MACDDDENEWVAIESLDSRLRGNDELLDRGNDRRLWRFTLTHPRGIAFAFPPQGSPESVDFESGFRGRWK